MSISIPYEGKTYKFPDGTNIHEINEFLGIDATKSALPSDFFTPKPLIDVRDIPSGLLKSGQNFAATLGEAGQAIGSLGSNINKVLPEWMKVIPDVNIREELGLGKDRPVNFTGMFGGKGGAGESLAQYAPGALLGGSSLGSQALSNAIYGATQAQPDESNLLSRYLPGGQYLEGRPGAALETGLTTYGLGKAIPAVGGMIEKVFNDLRPGKAAEQFMREISQTPKGQELPTSQENIEELARRMAFAKGSAKEESLIPKRELYGQEGKSNVYDVNANALPEGNLPKMAEMISPKERYGEDQITALQKALRDYRTEKVDKEIGGTPIDQFLHKAEEIFNIPELPEKAATKIEDSLLMPTSRRASYFADKDVTMPYSPKGELMKLHEEFKSNPTLENYDALQSAMKKELRAMEARAKTSDTAQPKVDQLRANIKNLNADKEAFVKTLPEKMQNLETDFRTKYARNVAKYETTEKGKPLVTINKLAAEGGADVTPGTISSVFRGKLTPGKERILQDIGKSGINNIIYNELIQAPIGDAKALADAIIKARRTGGFGKFITPEHEMFAKALQKRLQRQTGAKILGGLIGGGLLGGTTYEVGKHMF